MGRRTVYGIYYFSKRSECGFIEELQKRSRGRKKEIYDSIDRPLFFERFDIFNDLIGYLSSCDSHTLMSNNWIIFGLAGAGATFHYDYFFTLFWNAVIEGSKYWLLIPPDHVLNIWNDSNKDIRQIQKLSNYEFFDQIYLNGFLDD